MLLQVGVRVPDRTDPLGLLAAGLRLHLMRLRGLAFSGAHLEHGDPDLCERAADALRNGLTYFARAADDPFREEVELLFPRLVDREPTEDLRAICELLAADRVRAAALHQILGDAAAELLEVPGEESALALNRAAEVLIALYRAHIDILETHLFPRARVLLDAAERRALGQAMLDTGWATVLPDEVDHAEASAPTGLP